jgi:hypothetical protein
MTRIFNATFAKPIPRNVLALVKAKWEAASAEATGEVEGLPPFKSFKRARPKDPHFPGIACYRRRTGKIFDGGNMLLNSTPEFAVEVALEGDDEEELLDRLETYVEVVDSIIRTAAREESGLLLDGFPEDSQVLVTIDIPEHVYGQDVPQQKKHIRVAALTLTAELTEV